MRTITYAEALNEALHEEMQRDPNVFVLGEDIGILGGLFQVTKGLLDEFGTERVIDTPISEAAIAGAGIGASLVGAKPVIEFQFNDFMTIAMDQIVNHAAKLRYMTGGQATVPLVIRAPICSGIGMGAQHSQSLEAWFAHIPGLIVVMPSTPYAAKGLLKAAIRNPNPVIFLEHRLLYATKGPVPEQNFVSKISKAVIHRKGTDLTIVATGRMVGLALTAAERLSKDGVDVEVLDPQTLKPLDTEAILTSVRKTKRLVIVNEGSRSCGYAAEISAMVAELAFEHLAAPIHRVTSKDVPMPVSRVLEKELLPDTNAILDSVKACMAFS
ncbi:MAG: alpha-ketoacid dehydrogenase subunit beta [Lentisphaeria bacterium]|nr:alpha-ketoacid dehydrogenase subunit beta [Lentisphaeria bacterium]NQZ69023.1 alpha-ketoacid dehydrogenase subunit beta [Lentisphaeria bacterium]